MKGFSWERHSVRKAGQLRSPSPVTIPGQLPGEDDTVALVTFRPCDHPAAGVTVQAPSVFVITARQRLTYRLAFENATYAADYEATGGQR